MGAQQNLVHQHHGLFALQKLIEALLDNIILVHQWTPQEVHYIWRFDDNSSLSDSHQTILTAALGNDNQNRMQAARDQ
eukprot:3586868-Rhodomonas_salina.1